jgi:hypothetical protein
MHTKFWSENPKGRDYSEELGVDGTVALKYIVEKLGEKLLTGFIWLRIRMGGGFL